MATGHEVAPLDMAQIDPAMFSEEESLYAYYLAHLSTLANAVVMEGDHRGFINLKVWRRDRDNEPYNARILENHASLSFFYTEKRPWNPYYGDAALKARLEAVMDFWCRCQNDDGRFSEYAPEQWSLAPTGFGVKFMGETLRRLHASEARGGPTVDPDLFARTVAAARKAIEVLLTHPDLLRHATNFSNQYTGFWGGFLAFVSAFPDADLHRRFVEMVRTFGEKLTSPAGYHYERSGCDWQYTMGTHRSNMRDVWRYVRGTELGQMVAEMEKPWMDWLGYNAVLEPDGSYFTMNRAIETRTGLAGFASWETPVSEAIPPAHAFSRSRNEYEAYLAHHKQALVENWPQVEPLTTYSPHIFVNGHPRLDWYPSEAQRDAARKTLPYLARDRYTHFRMDDRFQVHFMFVRRPNYYAAFNSGEKLCDMQRYGLGLLWHPQMGSLVQTQSREAGAWGTAPEGGAVYEAEAFFPEITVGGKPFAPSPGKRDLADEDMVFVYSLGSVGRKAVRFAEDHLEATVDHAGAFAEHLPLLIRDSDHLTVAGNEIRLSRAGLCLAIACDSDVEVDIRDTGVSHGPFKLKLAVISARDHLTYRFGF